MFALKRLLYERSPSFVKKGIGTLPFHWLAGKSYKQVRRRDNWIASASEEELRSFQRTALHSMLLEATANVPAYRPFRGAVEELPPEEAISHFPLLDKEQIKSKYDRYRSTAVPRYHTWTSSTGGTTGDQLQFVLDDGAQSREMGFFHRLWGQLGYTPKSRKATFRGVEFSTLAEGKYWQDNPIYNECQFSPFHLSAKHLPAYLKQMRLCRPGFIHGYPSAVALLAELLLDCGESFPLNAVLLGSESIFPEQRETIEKAFHCRVFSWYGHSERVILAGVCKESEAYHSVPDYGWLEIVDEHGSAVREGEWGELVGTGFWNRAMPLIRYRTGDRARRLSRECACGQRHERFDHVEGRWKQEYVIGRSGARISVAALNMHGRFYDRVLRYQYFQDRVGHMELRILPGDGFDHRDVANLKKAFDRRVSRELVVTVTIVKDIPLTPRGKLRRLIQKTPGITSLSPNLDLPAESLESPN